MNASHRTLSAVLLLALCVPAAAQAADAPGEAAADVEHRSPLGIRQDRVKRLMQDLERKFKGVAQALEKSEPERAERLVKAFQESKHLLIESRMAEISRLLDQARYDTAGGNQEKLIADLRILIRILTEDDEFKRKEHERERLERWRDEVRRLLETERRHERESDKVANKDRTLADLDRQIKRLERLIERQRDLAEETTKTRGEGVAGLPSLADKQREVRLSTQELAEDVAGGGRSAGAEKPGGVPPTEAADGQQPDGGEAAGGGTPQPGEGGGAESGAEGQGGSSSEAGGGQPSEGGQPSAAGGQPSAGGEKSDAAANQPGVQSLRRATENQQAAEQNLGDSRAKVAEANQQRAIAEMEQALDQLRGERSRIASLPPEAFEQMARDQDDTADETARLQEDMSPADQSGGDPSGGGQSGGGQSGGGESGGGQSGGGQSPPRQQVQKAQKSMRGASDDLRKQDADSAADDQRKAIAELQKALEEIEQRLAQLREEMAIERLARLEARFREMLARQEPVTLTTATLEQARDADGRLPRSQRLKVAKLAAAERDIDELAQQALDIIIEDGTSVVFPRIVQNLSEDLQSAATLLDAQRTGSYTQAVQQEIEQTLEELIEALERARKQQQQQGGGGGGGAGDGMRPLLPPSAELKLLRSAQLRVNRRTKALDAVRGEDPDDDVLELELRKITALQGQIVKITEEMLEKY
jgi:hypothetical protein